MEPDPLAAARERGRKLREEYPDLVEAIYEFAEKIKRLNIPPGGITIIGAADEISISVERLPE